MITPSPKAPAPRYFPIPSIHSPAPVATVPAWLPIKAAGTGGFESGSFYLRQSGYTVFEVVCVAREDEATPNPAEMMREIKNEFGRTMSRLPSVFGVSRQTLYNWLDGETPKATHQEKLLQLARAARAFSAAGFKPTTLSLARAISQGKSLLQLLADGADGQETAERLVRIARRGEDSKAKLNQLLKDRKALLEPADFGTPTLDENS
jgi:transcriptional regulator with XRE-family HTH domain